MSGAVAPPRLFGVSALAVALLGPWLPDPLPVFTMVLLALVILLAGVPHGGLDPLLAGQWMKVSRPAHWLLFLSGYLVPVAAMVALWWALPDAFLVLFLLLSIHHFGADLAGPAPLWRRVVHGGTLVVLPALLYADTLQDLFGMLAPASSPLLVAGLAATCLPWLGVALLDALWCTWRGDPEGQPRLWLTLSAVLAPPLLSFAVYFCCWHAPGHIGQLRRRLNPWPRIASAIAAGSVTLVIGVAAFAWWWADSDVPRFVITSLFVGLGALTLPHMILVSRFQARAAP